MNVPFLRPQKEPEPYQAEETIQLDQEAKRHSTKVERPIERMLEWIKKDWWVIVGTVYCLVIVVQSVQQNVRAQNELKALESQLVSLEADKIGLEAELAFVKTKQVQEIALRRSFLLRRPNEQVFAVPSTRTEVKNAGGAQEARDSQQDAARASLRAWYDFVRFRL